MLHNEVEELKLIIATDTGTESAVAALQKQRDELLAALEHILAGSLSLPRFAEAEAIAVIASVKANT